jgi:hypothetical protein
MRLLNKILTFGGLTAPPRSAGRWSSLRWAALPITDRRWTAPLSAVAVGMGLFIGVAIGPSTSTTLGTPAQPAPTIAQVATTTTPAAEAAPAAPIESQGPAKQAATSPALPAPEPAPSSSVPALPVTPSVPAPSFPTGAAATPPPAESRTGSTTTESDDAATAEPAVTELAGTVIHVNPLAKSYALAGGGEMNAVHTRDLPDPGTKLDVRVRTLANGTYAEDGPRHKHGSKGTAKFGGVVTYVDDRAGVYTVSARGASVLVHLPGGAGPNAKLPSVGADVTVEGAVGETPDSEEAQVRARDCAKGTDPRRPPETTVRQISLDVDADFVDSAELSGVVQGACDAPRRLVISADGIDEAVADLSLRVSDDEIRLHDLKPGDVLAATASIDERDETLELTAMAPDAGIDEADDATQAD